MSDFFDEIMNFTENAHKKKVEEVKEITPEEDERIDYWVDDIADHVKNRAIHGKNYFTYDCSKISVYMFEQLASRYKKKYPKFMVIRDYGRQYITVKWNRSNEV